MSYGYVNLLSYALVTIIMTVFYNARVTNK